MTIETRLVTRRGKKIQDKGHERYAPKSSSAKQPAHAPIPEKKEAKVEADTAKAKKQTSKKKKAD